MIQQTEMTEPETAHLRRQSSLDFDDFMGSLAVNDEREESSDDSLDEEDLDEYDEEKAFRDAAKMMVDQVVSSSITGVGAPVKATTISKQLTKTFIEEDEHEQEVRNAHDTFVCSAISNMVFTPAVTDQLRLKAQTISQNEEERFVKKKTALIR